MLDCKYCGIEQKDKRFKAQHERFCKQNPDPSKPSRGMLGKKGIGGGRRPDGFVVSESTREKLREANSGRTHTDATKKLISDKRKEYLRLNPEKVPYRMNHKSRGQSQPEKYWQTVLENHGQVFVPEFRFGLYSLDFAFPELKVDLEIDGSQHYLDPKVVLSDQTRNTNLQRFGWRVIRVVWVKYINLAENERKTFVQTIIDQIHNGTQPLFVSPEPKYTDNEVDGVPMRTYVLKEKKEKVAPVERLSKITATPTELQQLVDSMPLIKIGLRFGVCDNAVKKRCKKYGILLRPQGYWNKPENR